MVIDSQADIDAGVAGAAAPATVEQIGGTDGTNLRAMLTDTSGRPNVLSFPNDGLKTTYRAFTAAAFSSAALTTDLLTITGSATKTIRVLRAWLSGTQTTSGEVNLFVVKRSTANSAGTSTTLVNVPSDSADAAGTAVVRSYTANPTTGTLIGTVAAKKTVVSVAAIGGNAGPAPVDEVSFGNNPAKALILRGTGEVLAFNLNGVTITGNSWVGGFEWTEES